MNHPDHDELEQRVADAGMPGLAAMSALARRLNGTDVAAAASTTGASSSSSEARTRSRLFLYTGSQR